jgi:ElaB/YqjD/DUF883 family membrane-anchored ribosome-binding protein
MEATVQENADKVMHDLKVLVSDAEHLLKSGATDLGERGRELRAKLQASIETAKATCQRVEDRAVAGAKAADKVIREHPYQSAGVAFGLGLLIGVLAARVK